MSIPFPLSNHKFVFYICDLYIQECIYLDRNHKTLILALALQPINGVTHGMSPSFSGLVT